MGENHATFKILVGSGPGTGVDPAAAITSCGDDDDDDNDAGDDDDDNDTGDDDNDTSGQETWTDPATG